jgi:hypothetical protein
MIRIQTRQNQPIRVIMNIGYGAPPVTVGLEVILNNTPLDTMDACEEGKCRLGLAATTMTIRDQRYGEMGTVGRMTVGGSFNADKGNQYTALKRWGNSSRLFETYDS